MNTSVKAKKSLREEMPETARFIDMCREIFGKDVVDDLIRRGMKGEPVFFASEKGREIGTQEVHTSARSVVGWDRFGVSHAIDLAPGDSYDFCFLPNRSGEIDRGGIV